jgi:hypothetical protein
MSVRIYFNFVHPWFHEPLRVPLDWSFPFLPRIGESVHGWIWIKQGEWEQSQVEKELSVEGKKSWESHRAKKFGFDDWLYEMSMECSTIFEISYFHHPDWPSGEIRMEMWLNEDGKQK